MYYTFSYRPVWGFFNRYIETVWANNYYMAERKFYDKVGNNVSEVLSVETSRH